MVGLPWIKKWWESLLANYRNTKDKNVGKKIIFILFAICKFLYIVPLSLLEGTRNQYKRDKPGPVIFLRPMYLAGAYIITLSGAQKLLELSQPVVYPADRVQNQARIKKGLIFRCYAPLVVFQQNKEFGSSILELSGDEIV